MLRERFLPVKNIGDLVMTPYYYLFYACLFSVAGLFLIKPMGEYLSGDASFFVALVQEILGYVDMPNIDLHSGLSIWHPLLYVGLLTAVGKVLGPHLIWFRALGIVFLLLDLYLIKKVCFLMVENQRQGRFLTFLSCALFLMIPFTLKGGVHIDIDNSVLTPILLFFTYAFIRYEQASGKKKIRYAVITCLALTIGLWAKLTTPLLLPVAVALYYLVKHKPVKAFVYPLLLTLIAAAVFLLTWYVFCNWADLPPFSVFKRMVGRFAGKVEDLQDISELMRYISVILFAMNPLLLSAWLASIVLQMKNLRQKKTVDDASIYVSFWGIIVGIAYLFIGGTTYGIPKYYFPLIALVSLTVGRRLYPHLIDMRRRKFFLLVALCAACALMYMFLGDPLYLINHELKAQALMNASFKPVLVRLAVIFALYTVPLIAVIWLYLLGKQSAAAALLVFAMFSQMLGLDLRQAVAPYQIVYGYGYKGLDRVHKHLSVGSHVFLPEAAIIPPVGCVGDYEYDSLPKVSATPSLQAWKSYVESRRPDVVVCGTALNTVAQVRQLFGRQEFKKYMAKDYEMMMEGDYCLYLRRK